MAWAFVQIGTANLGTATTFAIPMGTLTAGNTLIALASWGTDSFTSISDNLGNTYTQIGTPYTPSATSTSRVYYAKNITGGVGTVTFVWSTAPAGNITVEEYSGLSTTAPYDNSYSNNAITIAAGSFNTGTVTTSQANDLLWGYVESPVTQAVGEASWTQRSTLNGNLWSDKNAVTTGNYSFTGTLSPTDTSDGWIVAFKQPGISNLVQSSGTAVLGLGSTSVIWGVNTTTGNLIVVGVNLTNAATLGTVSSITDSQANTYIQATKGTVNSLGDILNVELWYAKTITGGAGSITVNHTIDNCAMFAREYSGFDTLDVAGSANGSSTTPNSGTVTTTVATELLIVATGDDKGTTQTWTAAGAYVDMVGTATTLTGLSMEDGTVGVTGAQTGTLTLGAAANWDALFASFYKATVAGAANTSFKTLLGVGNI